MNRRALASVPVLGPALVFGWRASKASRHQLAELRVTLSWLLRSRETTNYTYDLDPINRTHLVAFVACVTGCPYRTIEGYVRELEDDEALRAHIAHATLSGPHRRYADPQARYGRRLGWYALARALKPRAVVETGVDKGLGACVLAAALLRNRDEGGEGRYYGFDIKPDAGYLFTRPYAEVGEIRYGDALASLEKFEGHIDLLITDSDHSPTFEQRELESASGRLLDTSVILADNAHATRALLDFALATGRRFLFFAERPANHWYRGDGIGAAYGASS